MIWLVHAADATKIFDSILTAPLSARKISADTTTEENPQMEKKVSSNISEIFSLICFVWFRNIPKALHLL